MFWLLCNKCIPSNDPVMYLYSAHALDTFKEKSSSRWEGGGGSMFVF